MSQSITSSNAILMLGVKSLFTTPQQIQGFTADDIFDTDDVDTSEIVMGLDGKLSAGYVPVAIKQNYTIMPNSASNSFFESIYASEVAAKEKYWLFGVISLPSISRSYVLTNGIMTGYKPVPDAKKVLQPRKFSITWELVVAAPL